MNVLFIVADQLRYDCVGASGIRPVKTPNIDALAAEGLYFENAYTPLPVCAPSRQAMLTGV
ncbi:MAG: sulfatase-like hydrolase/transferase, partial [Clostridia bacterium]|nr:sulfatase-like hydrolase/transferase [Clostridia bacterium]